MKKKSKKKRERNKNDKKEGKTNLTRESDGSFTSHYIVSCNRRKKKTKTRTPLSTTNDKVTYRTTHASTPPLHPRPFPSPSPECPPSPAAPKPYRLSIRRVCGGRRRAPTSRRFPGKIKWGGGTDPQTTTTKKILTNNVWDGGPEAAYSFCVWEAWRTNTPSGTNTIA